MNNLWFIDFQSGHTEKIFCFDINLLSVWEAFSQPIFDILERRFLCSHDLQNDYKCAKNQVCVIFRLLDMNIYLRGVKTVKITMQIFDVFAHGRDVK